MPDEYRVTAVLHRDHLSSGMFPRLGLRFLRHYHATFAESPHGRALVARCDGRVLGFLVGTVSNADHYRWVVRHRGLHLAWHGAIALLRRPHVLAAFVSTRSDRYVRGVLRLARCRAGAAGATSQESRPDRIAVLTHVVTAADTRGKGIGRRLVDAFVAEAGAAGADQARLITSVPGPAEHFYERMGWQSTGERWGRDGGRVREYRLELREGDRP